MNNCLRIQFHVSAMRFTQGRDAKNFFREIFKKIKRLFVLLCREFSEKKKPWRRLKNLWQLFRSVRLRLTIICFLFQISDFSSQTLNFASKMIKVKNFLVLSGTGNRRYAKICVWISNQLKRGLFFRFHHRWFDFDSWFPLTAWSFGNNFCVAVFFMQWLANFGWKFFRNRWG